MFPYVPLFLKLGFTQCKAEQPLRGMDLRKKKYKRLKHIEKLFRVSESSYARKETVDIAILRTSRNGDRQIMQSIRIASRPPSRIRKWNKLSQFRWTSTKVMPIEKIYACYILTMSQEYKRSSKWRINSPTHQFFVAYLAFPISR